LREPLGLESGEVRVVEYDERWPSLFAAEALRLREACATLPVTLEHVGSTAVPGLCAKPVLDILAGHPPDTPAASYVTPFRRVGYEHRGDRGIPGHQFFRRGQPRAYHIHLVEQGGALWREYLAFRDVLRSDPDAKREYTELKRALAGRFSRDREGYIDGKTTFVRTMLSRVSGAA
jgi:GrpB-like predicted nucleotidyltransferase (UPF0157 family)